MVRVGIAKREQPLLRLFSSAKSWKMLARQDESEATSQASLHPQARSRPQSGKH